MRFVGFDQSRALELYFWNLRLSASFYPLLAGIEICLRNQMLKRLEGEFGVRWWNNNEFRKLLGQKGERLIKDAIRNLTRKNSPVTAGRITAELSFGFWSGMLLAKYEPKLWTPFESHFTNVPSGVDRRKLETRCESIRKLRNRISHHEPLIKRNISQDYSHALELLRWLSPEKAEWIKPRLEIMSILRSRP